MLEISIALLVLSIVIIVAVVFRHRRELSILNVDAIPEERTKKIKSDIISKRVVRAASSFGKFFKKEFEWVFSFLEKSKKQFRQKLGDLELSYERAKRLSLGSRGKRTAQIVGLLREAEELYGQEKLEEAEKKYVSVISLDSRNIDAYEGLGGLYLRMKNYADAREAFSFILKMRKEDASVETSLGEVALAEEKPELALKHFKKAIDRRPGNPKYLDFFIETAIIVGSKDDAWRGLRLMKETNPENTKIVDWERRIREL